MRVLAGRIPSPSNPVVTLAGPPMAVLARGLVAGQPFYLTAAFSDTAQREEAAGRLGQLSEPFLDARVIVSDVAEYPLSRIPVRRFLRALSRIMNASVSPAFPRLPAEGAIGHAEAVRRRAEMLRLVRALCSRTERYAYDLEEPMRLAFASRGSSSVIIEVFGGEDGVIQLDSLPTVSMLGNDPYERYLLQEQLGLSRNQRLGRMEFGTTQRPADDPVAATLAALSKKGESFNNCQPRLDVPFHTPVLQMLLADAEQRCFDDATALYTARTVTIATHPPQPTTMLIAVCPDIPEYGFVPGAHALAGIAVLDPDAGANSLRVHVSAASRRPDYGQVKQAFREGFEFELPPDGPSGAIPEQGLIYSTYGPANSVLARLLGHRVEDIRIL